MKRKWGETRRREERLRRGTPGRSSCSAGAARPAAIPVLRLPRGRSGPGPAAPARSPAGPRLTRAVQEEPEQQRRAEGCVCRPHPAPACAHGASASPAPRLRRPGRPQGSAGRAGRDTGSAPRRGQGGPALRGRLRWAVGLVPALARANTVRRGCSARFVPGTAPALLCPAGPFLQECVFPEPFPPVLPLPSVRALARRAGPSVQSLRYSGADAAGRAELWKARAAMGRAAGAVQRLLEVVAEALLCVNPAINQRGYSMCWFPAPGKKRREAVPGCKQLHCPINQTEPGEPLT